jgi:hypothetical protein
LYHSLSGIIHLFSHGRFMMKLASDGCDIFAAVEGGCRVEWLSQWICLTTAPAKHSKRGPQSGGVGEEAWHCSPVGGEKATKRELIASFLALLLVRLPTTLHRLAEPSSVAASLPHSWPTTPALVEPATKN